ncbi:MAG: hypothetical protein AAF985_06100, partial [Bacteroidota bacterium]
KMEEQLFNLIGQSISKRPLSAMFGVPCFTRGRKPYLLLYEKQLVCKLIGEAKRAALQLEGASLFQPKKNRRAMGNWIQIPYEHSEKWDYFANLAFQFICSE